MISRRAFLEMLAATGGAMALPGAVSTSHAADLLYDPPRFGNLSVLQIGDTHAQLLPTYYREASVNIGLGQEADQPPFLVGESLLERYRVMPSTRQAYALVHSNFRDLAEVYGRTGGYAQLATVIKQLRGSRPDALLLDCGDSFQGSGTALWSHGADMAAASNLLGVDAMTGSTEFSLGTTRLAELFWQEMQARSAFLAYNVQKKGDAESPAKPFAIYFVGGTPVGVIGQASPQSGRYGASPVSEAFDFAIDEARLQSTVDAVRGRGAKLVIVLSQAGVPIDLKLASRVRGIDVFMSGHSHDPLPAPIVVKSPSGSTLVSSVGAYGKFCGVLDLDIQGGRIRDYRFRLIPIFSNLIPPDAEMAALVAQHRAPFLPQLETKLADNEMLLFRRGNFYSSTDHLILSAMLAERNAEIAFTPGFRCGTTLLPGEPITLERVLEQVAMGRSGLHVEAMSGERIRQNMEVWLDEVFNPDPYLRSGEDMVRIAGLSYRCNPAAAAGARISEILVRGKPIKDKTYYKTVSWGLPGQEVTDPVPIWSVVADYLKQIKTVVPFVPVLPKIDGVAGNRGQFDGI